MAAARPRADATLGALAWQGGADPNLSPAARDRLHLLDQVLRARGVKATITSGRRRPDGTRSHHHSGDAIDFVTPGGAAEMEKLAADLSGLGFRVQFERKGQRNPGGSVATGDHLHVTLIGEQPKPPVSSRLAAFRAAGQTESEPAVSSRLAAFRAAGEGAPAAVESPRLAAFRAAGAPRDSAPAPGLAPAVPASPRLPRPGEPGGGPDTGVLGGLNRFATWLLENVPGLAERTERQARRGPLGGAADLYKGADMPGQAIAAGLNEAMRTLRIEEMPADEQLQAAIAKGVDVLMGRAKPEPARAGSIALGIGPNSPLPARAVGTALDFLIALRTDPLGKVADPFLRETGAAGVGAARAAARRLSPAGAGAAATAKALLPPQAAAMAARMRAYVGAGPQAKQVAKEVEDALRNAQGVSRWVQQGIGTIKGALVGNPATATVNAIGNHLMARLALDTARIAPDRLGPALAASLGEVGAYAKSGGKHVSPMIQEMMQHTNAFQHTFAHLATAPTATGPAARAGKAVATAAGVKPSLAAQDLADKAYKLAVFKAAREAGQSPQEAAKLVNRFLFDYSDRSALITFVERYGIAPFSTFGTKAARAFVEGIATRPDLMRRFLTARERMFADPKDRAAFEKLPEHEKGLFTLPTGGGRFVNLNRFNPWGGALDTVRAARDFAEGKLPVSFLREQAGRPLASKPIAGLFNQRLVGDELAPLAHPGAPPTETTRAFWREMGKSYLPALAPFGRGWQRLAEAGAGQTPTDAKSGAAQPLGEALLQTLIGLRGVESEPKKDTSAIARRKAVAAPVYQRVFTEAQARPGQNPYTRAVSHLTPEKAKERLRSARKYASSLLTSGRVVDSHGRLTAEGTHRLIEAAWWTAALRRRAGE